MAMFNPLLGLMTFFEVVLIVVSVNVLTILVRPLAVILIKALERFGDRWCKGLGLTNGRDQ